MQIICVCLCVRVLTSQCVCVSMCVYVGQRGLELPVKMNKLFEGCVPEARPLIGQTMDSSS